MPGPEPNAHHVGCSWHLDHCRCDHPWRRWQRHCLGRRPYSLCGSDLSQRWADRWKRGICRSVGEKHARLYGARRYLRACRADRNLVARSERHHHFHLGKLNIIAGPTFTGTALTSNLNVTTLQTALGTNNVIVDTTSPFPSAGNITVSNAVTWGSANSLDLRAHNDITVNAGISSTGLGVLRLIANQDGIGGGNVALNAAISSRLGGIQFPVSGSPATQREPSQRPAQPAKMRVTSRSTQQAR